jgi:aspartokinase-like uncharacterized kinase
VSKQKETLFKERVQRDLRKLPHTWNVKIQQVALRGIPDILVCLRGQFIALELKRDEAEKPDRLQQVMLDRIVAAGGWAFAAYPQNWATVFSVLEHLAHGRAKTAAEAVAALNAELMIKEDETHH